MNNTVSPKVTNTEADQQFRLLAESMGLDPDSLWVGGYVDYEWKNTRFFFQEAYESIEELSVLEFGCNYGATSIVLASMGANVTAIDVNEDYVNLARLNAQRYGVENKIRFLHLEDTTSLPFKDIEFDLVTCNSVLEYVPNTILKEVQKEIDRVLKPGGKVFVLGTSNRIWPKEVHSNKWFVNYLPRLFDNLFFPKKMPERGVFPWQITKGFGQYVNCDLSSDKNIYLSAKSKIGISSGKLKILKTGDKIFSQFGITIGILTPSICVVLKKSN